MHTRDIRVRIAAVLSRGLPLSLSERTRADGVDVCEDDLSWRDTLRARVMAAARASMSASAPALVLRTLVLRRLCLLLE